MQREATDEAAFRLALVENIHREDLSHQEKVEALDMLGEMVEGHGLRRTALELNMSPGWLSRRLSMRQDPVVFPALEEGRISFAVANELLAAPAVARRTLLDRVLRSPGRVPSADARAWVNNVRHQARQGQLRLVSEAATTDSGSPPPVRAPIVATSESAQTTFTQLVEAARTLGVPTSTEEIAALYELVAYLDHLQTQMCSAVSAERQQAVGASAVRQRQITGPLHASGEGRIRGTPTIRT